MKLKHKSAEGAAAEIAQAIMFDLRDVPQTKAILDDLIARKGQAGRAEFQEIFRKDVERDAKGLPGPVLFPWGRSAIRTLSEGEATFENLGLGFWGVIGGVLSAGINVVGDIFTTRYTVKAQKDIAQIQATTEQKKIEAVQAQADAEKARAIADMQAMLRGNGQDVEVKTVMTPDGPVTVQVPKEETKILGMSPMTLGIVAVGGIAAIFILPKILGR